LPKKLTVSQTRSLRNIVDNPALPAVLEHMQPKTLVRLIDRMGLNDAAELMALVPKLNLLRALDEATWKIPCSGANPVFDPAEFINWLQVWNELGELFVAERLGAMSDEYLGLCLSSVLHAGYAGGSGLCTDESESEQYCGDDAAGCVADSGTDSYQVCGHYLLRPAFEYDWEIVRTALDALWRHAPDRLLHILGTLVTSESMLNLHGRRIALNADVAFARERHLERRGYVSPAGAQAFLASVSVTTQELLTMSAYDNETRRFLEGIENHDTDRHPVENAIGTDGANDELHKSESEYSGIALALPSQDQIRSLSLQLEIEGFVETKRFESLPRIGIKPKVSVLADMLQRLEGEKFEAFQQRTRELAYLATVLMAGGSLEGRPFTGGDARDGALATCNLGVEFIQSSQTALKLDTEPGLIRPFLIGWQFLDTVRDRVIDSIQRSLTELETPRKPRNLRWLHDEARIGMRDLRKAVEQRRFADIRDAMTFLSIVFDAAACQEIAPLLDHLPHFAPIFEKNKNRPQPQWIESISDLDRISSLVSRLSKE
jgi:hypothetical protein